MQEAAIFKDKAVGNAAWLYSCIARYFALTLKRVRERYRGTYRIDHARDFAPLRGWGNGSYKTFCPRQAREAEFEAEQERIRREKEKEIARLRAMQEKAQDYQAEQVPTWSRLPGASPAPLTTLTACKPTRKAGVQLT